MSQVVDLVAKPFNLVGSVLGALAPKPQAPKQVAPPPTAIARANYAVSDALRSRSGSSANQRTGAGGVESSTGKKTFMGQ